MIDAGCQSKKPFQRIGDGNFNILGRHTRVESGNHGLRQIDSWEEIHRHAGQTDQPDYANRQADHDDEVRVTNRKT